MQLLQNPSQIGKMREQREHYFLIDWTTDEVAITAEHLFMCAMILCSEMEPNDVREYVKV